MSKTLKLMALALFAFAMMGARAAGTNDGSTTPTRTGADDRADANYGYFNIDRWVEGTVQSIDAKSGKFTVHGHQRAWASEYAKMMKDIHDKSANLEPAKRQQKAAEIRQSYAETLNKARNETEKDTDYTFYLPKENNGQFMLFGEQGKEAGQMHSLADLKIGDHFTLGYNAGTLYNYAYSLFRGTMNDSQLENFMNTQQPEFAPKATR